MKKLAILSALLLSLIVLVGCAAETVSTQATDGELIACVCPDDSVMIAGVNRAMSDFYDSPPLQARALTIDEFYQYVELLNATVDGSLTLSNVEGDALEQMEAKLEATTFKDPDLEEKRQNLLEDFTK